MSIRSDGPPERDPRPSTSAERIYTARQMAIAADALTREAPDPTSQRSYLVTAVRELSSAIVLLCDERDQPTTDPIPMLLWCPGCSERHLDEGDFAKKPHHTHACQHCGHVWRPAIVPTVGVRYLPGFKNKAAV